MTQRTDTHSPSNFDPAEYTYAGFVDQHHEEGFEDIEDERANNLPYWRDTTDRHNGCDHCGTSGQRYLALFIHEPTQQVVVTGTRCAERLSLASRDQLDARARIEARRILNLIDAWRATSADNEVALAYLDSLDVDTAWYVLLDMRRKLRRYGSLSPAQVNVILNSKARDEERASRPPAATPTTPLEEGRREMSGTVVSTKYVDSEYGSTFKMLVVLDDLNKVWGTVPAAIDCDPKDMRVTFTATVERSRDDDHFGFFKRPSKAQVIDTERTKS